MTNKPIPTHKFSPLSLPLSLCLPLPSFASLCPSLLLWMQTHINLSANKIYIYLFTNNQSINFIDTGEEVANCLFGFKGIWGLLETLSINKYELNQNINSSIKINEFYSISFFPFFVILFLKHFTFLTISVFCFIFIFCVFEETHWKRKWLQIHWIFGIMGIDGQWSAQCESMNQWINESMEW